MFWCGFVAFALVVGGLIWFSTSDIWHDALEISADWGPWVGLILIGLMILHNFVPIPAEMIAISAGATCGIAYGIVVIWVGAMLGAVLAFWISRRFGRGILKGPKTAKIMERLDRIVAAGDWRALIVVRLIPLVSFNVINYGAGFTAIKLWTFVWTTAIGILPITIASVLAGAGIQTMGTVATIATIGAIILGVTFFKWRGRA